MDGYNEHRILGAYKTGALSQIQKTAKLDFICIIHTSDMMNQFDHVAFILSF